MRTLLRILTYLRPHRKRLAITYICIAVVTVLNLLIPWVIKQVIDVGLASGSQLYMIRAALVVVAIAATRMIFSFGQRFGMESSGQMVSYDVRNQLYNHIQRLSFSYHTHAQTGQLMSRMAEDVGAMQRFVSGALLDSLSIVLMLGFIIVILFQLSWQLALISLLPMPILAYLVKALADRMRPKWRQVQQDFAQVTTVLQENLTGVQVVRAFRARALRDGEVRFGQPRLHEHPSRYDPLLGRHIPLDGLSGRMQRRARCSGSAGRWSWPARSPWARWSRSTPTS